MTDPSRSAVTPAKLVRATAAVIPDSDADPLDVADALWLRQYLPGVARSEPPTPTPNKGQESSPSGPAPQPQSTAPDTTTDVAATGDRGETRTAATVLRVPVPPAVARTRDLARALHPLGRRRPSPNRREMDVEETVRRAADAGDQPWDLVERPVADRWLTAAVVVDTSASAAVWQATVRGLVKLLAESGMFARFRVWFWDSDASLPGVRATRATAAARPTSSVLDPGGPQVVLVLTDAAGQQWQSLAASRVLTDWAKAAHVAVLHLLPERLWDQTGLASASVGAVAGVGLAPLNGKLLTAKPAPAGPRFPVFALDARSVSQWSGLVAATLRGLVPAYVFSPTATPRVTWRLPTSGPSVQQAGKALDDFWAVASPTARQLAGLLAASAPYVSLPVLRLVSRALVSDATNLHEAEVLTGGLLRETARSVDGDPEKLVFQFPADVRDLLADGVPVEVAARSREKVAAEIDRLTAAAAATAAAAVPEPGGETEVFAEGTILKVHADLLRRLRGKVTPSPAPHRPPNRDWPTAEEAAKVPRWAMLALLTRVVRRLRPFFVREMSHGPDAIDRLDRCLTAAECLAAAPGVQRIFDRFQTHDKELRAFRDGSDYWPLPSDQSPARTIGGILSVSHMWIVGREQWGPGRSVSTYSDFAFPARRMVEEFIDHKSLPVDAGPQFLAAFRADFDMAASRRYADDDDARFPAAYFGLLWPDGPPAGWPPDDQPAGPPLPPARFVQLADALSGSDFWAELLAEFEWYGGPFYAAMREIRGEERADWLCALLNEVTLAGTLRGLATAAVLVDSLSSRLSTAAASAAAGALRPVRDFRIRVQVIGTGGQLNAGEATACETLGRKLAQAGFGLIGWGFMGVDETVAKSFANAVAVFGSTLDDTFTHFDSPAWNRPRLQGRVIRTAEDRFADLALADAVILIGGYDVAAKFADEAVNQSLPILPLAASGRAAAALHKRLSGGAQPGASFPPVRPTDLKSLGGPLPEALASAVQMLDRMFPPPEGR